MLKRVGKWFWLPAIALLLIPIIWLLVAKVLGEPITSSGSSGALLATIGSVMGAVFAVGGIVVALVAVLSQLTFEDRASRFLEDKYQQLLPDLLTRAENLIQARIIFRDAQNSIQQEAWTRAEEQIEEVLRLNEEFPSVRSTLALAISTSVSNEFRQRHGILDPAPPVFSPMWQGGPGRPVQISLTALLSQALIWLDRAKQARDDPEGQVTASLALMYGVAGDYDKMKQHLEAACTSSDRSSEFRSSRCLPLLAHACGNNPGRLRHLRDILRLPELPVPAHVVVESIRQMDLNDTYLGQRGFIWFVMSTPAGRFAGSSSAFPMAVRIYGHEEQEIRSAKAMYYNPATVSGHIEVVNVPEDSTKYVLPDQLVAELSKLFLFICPEFPLPESPHQDTNS